VSAIVSPSERGGAQRPAAGSGARPRAHGVNGHGNGGAALLEDGALSTRLGVERLTLGRVALARDYLNQRGGAERVALELARMWPDAPLYTSLYRPKATFPEFREVDVRTSFLDRLPVDAGFRNLLPLYPAAFAALGPVDADVLITSSSGWAHGLRVRPGGRHVVYCHNPARWLYGAAPHDHRLSLNPGHDGRLRYRQPY
jgi:hypothetical protein